TIPFHILIIAALFITLFFGKRQEYRSYVWYGLYRDATPVKRAHLFFTLVSEGFKEKKLGMLYDGYNFLIRRANHLSELAVCIEETPSIIPYWHGRSLKPLLTAIIPRFVMPWKPVDNMGQEFGHRYNFISPNDYGTSINLPMLIELYINFGVIGILIGMFLIGVVYRILYRIMNYEGMGEGVAVIGAIIFMNLMNIESNISLVFGNVVENTIIMYLIFVILKIRK
ncbi:MAG TPA: O-antigen polysaccharide polymerase Wzy, partial [candidate division WOR-3 bacterium]|nr:O-antigen polysaccharide polymerase Wzy [candidate division WOR-3 bacterium]